MAQSESKQLKRPFSNLMINNELIWVPQSFTVTMLTLFLIFLGAITLWALVLGATSKSIARAPLASKCGHYLLLKILLFQILPQLPHFSHLFVCVKCCVCTQFLIRHLEFYTFIAKVQLSFFFLFLFSFSVFFSQGFSV